METNVLSIDASKAPYLRVGSVLHRLDIEVIQVGDTPLYLGPGGAHLLRR